MATPKAIFLWWVFAMTIAIVLGCAMTHCTCREEDDDGENNLQQIPRSSVPPPPLEEAAVVVELPSGGMAVVAP